MRDDDTVPDEKRSPAPFEPRDAGSVAPIAMERRHHLRRFSAFIICPVTIACICPVDEEPAALAWVRSRRGFHARHWDSGAG